MQDYQIERGATSVILHVYVEDASTGNGKTGLDEASSGLVISAQRPGEAAPTAYTAAAGNIEAISTIGTYAAPTAGKIRFGEIDATNLPGWYELHPDDALLNTTNTRRALHLALFGATGMKQAGLTVKLMGVSLQGTGVPVSDKTGFFLANTSISAATFAAGAIDAAAVADGAIDAGALAAGAITAAKIASGAIVAATFAAGAIDAAAVADGAIDAGAFTQGAADKVWASASRQLTGTQTFNLTGNITGNLTGSVGSISGVTFPSGFSSLTVAAIADGVWDELRAGHVVAGSFGEGVVVNSLGTGSIVAGTFAADALSASALSAAAVDKIIDEVIEGSYTLRQLARGWSAALFGLRGGGGTSTITLLGVDGATVRLTLYQDATGNSTAPPALNLS